MKKIRNKLKNIRNKLIVDKIEVTYRGGLDQQHMIVKVNYTGSRRFSNYFMASLLFLGGSGFLLRSSLFTVQGLVMSFYGSLGLDFSLYIIWNIIFNVGGGYNEYNRPENIVKIVRNGIPIPGANRKILLTYTIESIRAIAVDFNESLNPTTRIFLCLKDQRIIPLTPAEDLTGIFEVEEEAKEIAKLLELPLEYL